VVVEKLGFRSRFERARLQPLGKTAGIEKTFFAASWGRDDQGHVDPWKWLSASQEIETAAGSFDSVRLAPHFAQDDRQVSSTKMTDK